MLCKTFRIFFPILEMSWIYQLFDMTGKRSFFRTNVTYIQINIQLQTETTTPYKYRKVGFTIVSKASIQQMILFKIGP